MNKILLVDDHKIFTDGIHFLLENTTDLKVVGILHKGNQVLPFLSHTLVNIILLDIDLPDVSGFEVALMVKQSYPSIKILALSMLDDFNSIERMMHTGAEGYCVKSAGRDEVFKAIQSLRNGENYMPPTHMQILYNKMSKISYHRLTNREIEIIKLICQGVSSSEVADKLFLSTRTVETHRRNIYRKIDIHNNAELIHYAKKHLII